MTSGVLKVSTSPTGAVIHTTNLAFPVLVAGEPTSLSTNFSFSSSGELLRASGPAFALSSPFSYPVLSPRDGVRLLNAHVLTPLPSSSPTVHSVSTNAQSSMTHHATFTRAALSLKAFRMRDGAVWLVPVYVYSGTVDGQPTTVSLLALEPHFLANASSATPLVSNSLTP